MHVCSSWRCFGSSAFQIESVVVFTRLRGQPEMSRQLWSGSGPARHDLRARLGFAALGPPTETSCPVLVGFVLGGRSVGGLWGGGGFPGGVGARQKGGCFGLGGMGVD